MKIPKIGKKPLIITLVAIAVITVLTIGTVVYLNHTTVARVSDSSSADLQKTETTQETPAAETAPVVEEAAPAPAAQQVPVQVPQPVAPSVDIQTLARSSIKNAIGEPYIAEIEPRVWDCFVQTVNGVTEWSPSFGGWSKQDNIMKLVEFYGRSQWAPCYTASTPWQLYRNGFLNENCQRPNGDYMTLICSWN